MTVQLLELALYSRRGAKRSVEFRPGEVNIITGGPATGKSAVLDIVDYCLGGNERRVPAGVARDAVSWYGLTLSAGSTRVFVGRAGPRGKEPPAAAAIAEGPGAKSPDSPPGANTTAGAAVSAISRIVGIASDVRMPRGGGARPLVEATIRHALRFCLVDQGEMASRLPLLHSAGRFEGLPVADTLPYFLGAASDGYLNLCNALKLMRRRHRQAEVDLGRAESIRGDRARRGRDLLDEAAGAGIAGGAAGGVRAALERAAAWAPGARGERDPPDISEAQDEVGRLEARLGEASERLRAARAYAGGLAGYMGEARRQADRLGSVGLFEGGGGHDCPLCSAPLDGRVAGAEEMRDSLRRVQEGLESAEAEAPLMEGLIGRLEGERAELSTELRRRREALRSLVASSSRLERLREMDLLRAQVAGRISLWLEHSDAAAEAGPLRRERDRTGSAVRDLECMVGESVARERMDSIASAVSGDMGAMAKSLRLEHSARRVRFDPRRLDVAVGSRGSEILLQDMGGARNRLGYRLAAHLALHRHFAENDRPVPGFLILDQPSQAYYPRDRGGPGAGAGATAGDDRVALSRAYGAIFDATKRMRPRLQVIVTDQADLCEGDFRSAVREEWRGGRALVPADWV